MNDAQLLRYSRHILLPEFGLEGQTRLGDAHALIVGAGGLGCPAALYLATSGIGRLTLADPDRVDLTNLQRQILYRIEAVGAPKVLAARDTLQAVNPEVEVIALEARLEGAALEAAVARADIVLDCSDNFATRHAINRACVRHRRPLVSGAAIRFDAQLAVFDFRDPNAPCYACLFPEGGETEELRCAVMGVLAPLTGMIGALQAIEALRVLAFGDGPVPARLQLFDAQAGTWRSVRLARDAACGVCGSGAAQPSR